MSRPAKGAPAAAGDAARGAKTYAYFSNFMGRATASLSLETCRAREGEPDSPLYVRASMGDCPHGAKADYTASEARRVAAAWIRCAELVEAGVGPGAKGGTPTPGLDLDDPGSDDTAEL